MRLLDFPQFGRFRDQRDVRVLRHKDDRLDLWALRASDRSVTIKGRGRQKPELELESFHDYQNNQSWDAFGDARFIISFIAERHRFAKFVGVWEVLGKKRKDDGYSYHYETQEMPGFEALQGRLIVAWGDGLRSWTQWLHKKGNKEVNEILPPNYVKDFRGFYDFTLTHDQLVQMLNNPESNREWYRMLSSVSGVYLIADQHTGEQYVGSAYGVGGLWARWKAYVKNPSGGNIRLKRLLEEYPDRYRQFQFSILRVLEHGITKDAVIEQEVWAKRKLGCRAHGLNAN